MPSTTSDNGTNARPARKGDGTNADKPPAADSGGAPATEEDIGTEGAGTEPPQTGTNKESDPR
jgi:hypothetical protein